jgi:hypothetical protein
MRLSLATLKPLTCTLCTLIAEPITPALEKLDFFALTKQIPLPAGESLAFIVVMPRTFRVALIFFSESGALLEPILLDKAKLSEEHDIINIDLNGVELIVRSKNLEYQYNIHELLQKNISLKKQFSLQLLAPFNHKTSVFVGKHTLSTVTAWDKVPPLHTFFGNVFNLLIQHGDSNVCQLLPSHLADAPKVGVSLDKARIYVVNHNFEFSIFLVMDDYPWPQTMWKKIQIDPDKSIEAYNHSQLIVSFLGNYAALILANEIHVFDQYGHTTKTIRVENPTPYLLNCEFLYQDMHNFIVVSFQDKLVIYSLIGAEVYEISISGIIGNSRRLVNISYIYANQVAFTYINKNQRLKTLIYPLPLAEIIGKLPRTTSQPSEFRPEFRFTATDMLPRPPSPAAFAAAAARVTPPSTGEYISGTASPARPKASSTLAIPPTPHRRLPVPPILPPALPALGPRPPVPPKPAGLERKLPPTPLPRLDKL